MTTDDVAQTTPAGRDKPVMHSVATHYHHLGMKLRKVAQAMNLEDPQVISTEVEHITSRLPQANQKSVRLLEVGCGYGRLVEEFLKRGLSYTGLDINPAYVNACREQIQPAGRFYQSDFSEESLPRDQLFDVVAFPWLLLTHYDFPQQLEMLTLATTLLVRDRTSYIVFDHIPTNEVGDGQYTVQTCAEGDVLSPLTEDVDADLRCYIMNQAFAGRVADENGLTLQHATMQLEKVSKQYFFLLSGEPPS